MGEHRANVNSRTLEAIPAPTRSYGWFTNDEPPRDFYIDLRSGRIVAEIVRVQPSPKEELWNVNWIEDVVPGERPPQIETYIARSYARTRVEEEYHDRVVKETVQ